MRLRPALCLLSFLTLATSIASTHVHNLHANQTRSLNGVPASDGDLELNDEYFNILTLTLLQGFAVWRIKMFNDRAYLDRTRRSYWFGDRYYKMDNNYYLSTRDTCAYRMTETQRKNLMYEDGEPIFEIFYQCQRYAEYCCGLACCNLYDLQHKKQNQPRHMNYPWSSTTNRLSINIIAVVIISFNLLNGLQSTILTL